MVSFCLLPFVGAICDSCVATGGPATRLTALDSGLPDLVANRNNTVHPDTMSESIGNFDQFWEVGQFSAWGRAGLSAGNRLDGHLQLDDVDGALAFIFVRRAGEMKLAQRPGRHVLVEPDPA